MTELKSKLVIYHSLSSLSLSLHAFYSLYYFFLFFLQEHSCILHCIVGWDCELGAWSRIEGYPSDPNPNDPFGNVPKESLFNDDGRLNPSITILGNTSIHCTCSS